ncbi:thioesterase superfamily protein [Gordonibacter sp. An230]|uniref:acyl-CoA thioesterase n=1 Tax=Gordonibacter sp. An230 TaxID=1965592 RepID=UPI000B3801B9|nr:thioesterase family protein [Gordonibacter sp. An230]OUO91475.1 thioesterase superfamily protein [Gordonibacter sp. An230]
MRVCTPITIRYAETDMMGIVYHANYLLYFEDARTAFLEAIGFPYKRIEEAGFVSPVVDLSISFGEPLRYGDAVMVRTRVVSSRPTRTVYAYEVFKQGQDPDAARPCCTGESTHCLVDAKTFKPVSVKRALPELYERYAEALEPAEGDRAPRGSKQERGDE